MPTRAITNAVIPPYNAARPQVTFDRITRLRIGAEMSQLAPNAIGSPMIAAQIMTPKNAMKPLLAIPAETGAAMINQPRTAEVFTARTH